MKSYSEDNIIIDFSEVNSISRSFAHQYLTSKRESNIVINEVNVPKNVEQMFEIVKMATNKPTIKNLH
jgi:STAS-like domain of unknown function (DUF4325)